MILLKEFDVGYCNGSTVVSIRSEQDLRDIWLELKRGVKIILWCDGLRESDKSSRKRQHISSDTDSDDLRPRKKATPGCNERERQLEEALKTLQRNHANSYTQMQFRIWAEMYVGGYHKSLVDPPTNSMFTRAGGGGDTHKKKNDQDSKVVETFTEVAKQLSSALTPMASSSNSLGMSCKSN